MNRSVQLTLALLVATGTLILSGLVAWFSYQQRYAEEIRTGERIVQELVQTVRKSAEIAAFTGNNQIANEVIGSLMASELVAGAQLQGEHGLMVAQGNIGESVVTQSLFAPFNREQQVGTLRAVPDFPALQASARHGAAIAALWLFGLSVMTGLVVYTAVFMVLSRPLTRLSRQLHEILPGSPERLPLGNEAPRNELYRLTSDINSLLNTVEHVVSGERALREHITELEHRLRGMFERASVGIFLINKAGRIKTHNPAFGELSCHLHVQDDWIELLFAQPERMQLLLQRAATQGQPQMQDLQLAEPNDSQWRHVVLSYSGEEQGEALFQGLIYDITDRKQGELVMQRQADFDHLTGIYNRRAAEMLLPQRLQQQIMRKGSLAVLMMDLDRFKHINDNWGHDAGDQVLIEVARRLGLFRAPGDMLARLGGDEFLLVVEQGDRAQLATLASRIIREVGQWISIGPGKQDYVGCSIGIALFPQHGRRADELRNAADRAMYEVKRHGRNGYCFYEIDESVYHVVSVEVLRPPQEG